MSVALLRRVSYQTSGSFALDGSGKVIINRRRLPLDPGVYAFIDRGGGAGDE